MELSDLITGEKFAPLADYVHNHYGPVRRGNPATARTLYTDSDSAEELLALLPPHPVVVITHNGDRNITGELTNRMPHNVVAWFAQNVASDHPRVLGLPIGLENSRWFPQLRKKEKILAARQSNIIPSRLLYVNHNTMTNPLMRQRPYQLFSGQSWATAVHGRNGEGFDAYLAGILDHFYTISPQGNGLDCNRTWEILYCRRAPILVRNAGASFFEDMPILFVNNWEEITQKLLMDNMERFKNYGFDNDKLHMGYWRQRIARAAAQAGV